jgi:hypothetical protein
MHSKHFAFNCIKLLTHRLREPLCPLSFFVYFLFITLSFLSGAGYCQRRTQLSDVDWKYKGDSTVEVSFFLGYKDWSNHRPNSYYDEQRFDLRIEFMREDGIQRIEPSGKEVHLTKASGWARSKDKYFIEVELKPKNFEMLENRNWRVCVTALPIRGGGPGNALLSAIVPGLGDHFVKYPPRNGFQLKYLPISIGFLGTMGASFYFHQQAQKYYNIYLKDGTAAGMSAYNRAVRNRRASLGFLGVGGTIWLTDVISVLSRGSQNKDRHFP